jgi:uncharacterized coiled-coil DUF342 family protein
MRVPTIQECAQAGWTEVANLREKLKALEAQRDEYRENGDRLMRVADSFKAVRDEALAEVERLKGACASYEKQANRDQLKQHNDESLLRECYRLLSAGWQHDHPLVKQVRERLGL